MRWSSRDGLSLAVLVLGVLLIGFVRAPLAQAHHRVTANHDVYLLPPPSQTVVLSLGYRSAVADLIFGHVLVSNGIHGSEKRLFEFVDSYLETINELDPKFRDPYRFSDALLTLQTVPVPEDMFRKARDILLRGTRELPFDQELWVSAGQFMAYLAPQSLKNPSERQAFRAEGARLLAHSCELIGSNANIPYHCTTAASLLTQAGKQDAARRFLERTLLITDDPELSAQIRQRLEALGPGSAEQAHIQKFNVAWQADLPLLSHAGIDALGPAFDPAACAGQRPGPGDACTTSLRERFGPDSSN